MVFYVNGTAVFAVEVGKEPRITPTIWRGLAFGGQMTRILG